MAQTKHRDDQLFAAPVEFDKKTLFNAAIITRPADGTPNLNKIPAPTTGTTSVAMTEAQLLGGIHIKTPTAAQDFQLPTGAEISAAVLAVQPNFAIGDSFDFALVNLGGAGFIVTITGDTGSTLVGSATIDDAGADVNSSGLFRFRNTAADTWIGYRIA